MVCIPRRVPPESPTWAGRAGVCCDPPPERKDAVFHGPSSSDGDRQAGQRYIHFVHLS